MMSDLKEDGVAFNVKALMKFKYNLIISLILDSQIYGKQVTLL